MELLLVGVGMLACMALMMVVIPLGVKVVRRVRPGTTKPTPSDHDAVPRLLGRDGGRPRRNLRQLAASVRFSRPVALTPSRSPRGGHSYARRGSHATTRSISSCDWSVNADLQCDSS
jgi:hypothetical protein